MKCHMFPNQQTQMSLNIHFVFYMECTLLHQIESDFSSSVTSKCRNNGFKCVYILLLKFEVYLI